MVNTLQIYLTVKTLQKIREEDAFDLFWQNVLLLQESTEVHGPSLPRKRRAPARFEEGSSLGYQPTTPKDFYRQQYFECLDMCMSCIKDRFNQPGYAALKNLEDLLIKAANNENYNSDLNLSWASIIMILSILPLKFNWNYLDHHLIQMTRSLWQQ